ncbi:uncharacterized protein LOC134542409 [Bacillus rossius redtenbacheri]|uniref:uncharacterized protein LOC134542409 n=1 Tax=Bacillus rossius redtenbacheri TaxID=93214 RepID=UPI002FDCDB27
MEPPFVLLIIAAFCAIECAHGLECYVCTNQDANLGKCLQTIKTCEPGDDMCLSETSWGSVPYWSQGAEKQYYISKRCANNNTCVRTRNKYMGLCTHIWYEDWKCSDCCRGDRCNYYVFLSGSLAQSSAVVLGLCAASVVAMGQLLWT